MLKLSNFGWSPGIGIFYIISRGFWYLYRIENEEACFKQLFAFWLYEQTVYLINRLVIGYFTLIS